MQHKLKTWPEFYWPAYYGRKLFEIRKNDRDFKEGDTLLLQHYSTVENKYSGHETEYGVLYILEGGSFGLKEGYCIMSIIKI